MKKDPTFSQITYMVTGLMSSFVQKNGTIDEGTVRSCVDLAKVAYDYISELYPSEDNNTSKEKEEVKEENPFSDCDLFKTHDLGSSIKGYKNYVCYHAAYYNDLVKWLKEKKNIKNNRKIDNLINKYLRKNSEVENMYQYFDVI